MSTAHADPYPPTPCPAYPPQPPHVKVHPKKVRAGGTLEFVGTCFSPDQKVIAELDNRHEIFLGKFRADDNGTVRGRVEIPKRTEPGEHVFELEGKDPRLEASTEITVTRKEGHHDGDDDGDHKGDHDGDHKGDHDGDHKGDHKGDHDGDHKGDHDNDHKGDKGDREHGGHDQHRPSLAKTGNEKALALGGTAAGLLAAGTGAMMAVRRRRNS
ncbi:LPXTG cell wall anchor domain-containing protein [Streptomyces sp. CoH27]|uniref:LPXTG cell wall anchor domain-containing protein n=1 Tax=Streptomyces sp. CoH27 TaxID=2875763 RepID=UPI001CD57B71|nr:LPXTG cell wall anchor domain-containing protein [Streptomyces sp. CoH27]